MCNYSRNMYRDANLKMLNQGDCKFCQASQLSQTYKWSSNNSISKTCQFYTKTSTDLTGNTHAPAHASFRSLYPVRWIIDHPDIHFDNHSGYISMLFVFQLSRKILLILFVQLFLSMQIRIIFPKRKGNKNYISKTHPHIQNLKCLHMLSVCKTIGKGVPILVCSHYLQRHKCTIFWMYKKLRIIPGQEYFW